MICLGYVNIHDYDVINFPGGFAFGDDLGSGKVLANKIKYKKLSNGKTLIEELTDYIAAGKFIFGVCNGFQALVKIGLLPNIGGNFDSEVTLTLNDSGKFEDRWVKCAVNKDSQTPFLKGLGIINLPVRHGEGKLLIQDDGLKETIIAKALNCISYVDENDHLTSTYPWNPNGSHLNAAGLCDPTGQVLGMMPHPEAYLSFYNNPNWGQLKRQNPEISEEGEGLKIFKNIVNHIKEQS